MRNVFFFTRAIQNVKFCTISVISQSIFFFELQWQMRLPQRTFAIALTCVPYVYLMIHTLSQSQNVLTMRWISINRKIDAPKNQIEQ